MSLVSVTINGRVYRMACDDGQEEHLVRLARDLDARIGQLRQSFGEIGDTRLAVMAAIMIADELSDQRRQLRDAEEEIRELKEARVADTAQVESEERVFAETIEAAAERIERLAMSLGSRHGTGAALG